MKKLERQRAQKKKAYEEDIALAKEKAEQGGYGFIDHELPPDEVDEKQVARSLWYTVKTFIPFSNEYYEAMAAEEEMDNLKKIRIEKVKAADFLTMSKIGRHEEALETMMSETNYDFFYFNKLKTKMEEEGKFKFEPPKDPNIFELLEKGPNRNRLRKAINQSYSAMDSRMTDELLRLTKFSEGQSTAKRYGNDQPCIWRGTTKSGENLRCDNSRLPRPIRENASLKLAGIQASPSRKDVDYFPYCAYHVPFCISTNHNEGQNVKIRIPNLESLCAECYMLVHKKRPPNHKADNVPGVVNANFKVSIHDADKMQGASNALKMSYHRELMKYLKNRHFATPIEQPPPPIKLKRYKPPPPPANVMQNMGRLAKLAAYTRRYIRDGKRAATKIQATYRMYRCKNLHLTYFYIKQVNRRWQGAIRIQSNIRKFLESKYMIIRRKLYHGASKTIQRIYRGFVVRYWLLKERSAKRIQKFMKKLYFFKFRDAVILVMQLRLLFIKRHNMAIFIQRVYRGYSARTLVFHMRYWNIISNTYARKIQRWWWIWLAIRRKKPWTPPSDEYLYSLVSRKVCMLLCNIYNDYKKRKALLDNMNTYMPVVQRIIRGFLAKRGVRKLQHVRNVLQNFVKPVFMHAFYQKMVVNSTINKYIYTTYTQPRQVANKQEEVKRTQFFLRKHLPLHLQNFTEVHYKIFTQALMDYYRELQLPLSQYECMSILRKFKNPMNNNIFVVQCDEYIYAHVLPCQKHGRTICVDCIVFRECILKRCKCKRFQGTGAIGEVSKDKSVASKDAESVAETVNAEDDGDGNVSPQTKKTQKSKEKNTGSRGGGKGYFCVACSHSKHLHRFYPTQYKPPIMIEAPRSDEDGMGSGMELVVIPPAEVKEPPFLATLNYEREGDISLPMGVEGREVKDILLPHLTYDDVRTYRAKNKSTENDVPPIYTTLTFQEGINEHNASYMQFCHPASKFKLGKRKKKMKNNGKEEEDIVAALAKGLVEGDEIQNHRGYWDTPDVSVLHPLRTLQVISAHRGNSSNPSSNPSSRGSQIGGNGTSNRVRTDNPTTFAPITSSPLAPSLELSYQDFWGKVAQLPIKTKEQYDKQFAHNMPLPLIQGNAQTGLDGMQYTLNGAEVYFNVLNLILAMEKDIHEDNPVFLRLVFNHIQVFERHWKEFVQDISAGTLSSQLTLPGTTRERYASMAVPRPHVARRLDQVFRNLGFHDKVLGAGRKQESKEDAHHPLKGSRGYAEKRVLSRSGDEGLEKKRRPSLPFEPSEDAVMSMSRPPSPNNANVLSSSRPSSRMLFPSSADLQMNVYSRGVSREGGARGMSRGTSRGVSREGRRGSDSELIRPVSMQGAQETHHTLLTLPRVIKGEDVRVKVNPLPPIQATAITARTSTIEDDSDTAFKLPANTYKPPRPHEILHLPAAGLYVCPHPGCGKTYTSAQGVYGHIPTHNNAHRLSISTPHVDAFMHVYWPKEVFLPHAHPVKDDDSYTSLPPGSIPCPYANCTHSFPSPYQLQTHLRMIHNVKHPSELERDGGLINHMLYALPSPYTTIPPDSHTHTIRNPHIPVPPYCPSHTLPNWGCYRCMEIESSGQNTSALAGKTVLGMEKDFPLPPFRFLASIRVSDQGREDGMAKKKGKGRKRTVVGGKEEGVQLKEGGAELYILEVLDEDTQSTQTSKAKKKTRKAYYRLVCMCMDRNDRLFLGVEKMLTKAQVEESMAMGRLLPIHIPPPNHANLLIPYRHTLSAADLRTPSSYVTYIPAHRLVAMHPLQAVKMGEEGKAREWCVWEDLYA